MYSAALRSALFAALRLRTTTAARSNGSDDDGTDHRCNNCRNDGINRRNRAGNHCRSPHCHRHSANCHRRSDRSNGCRSDHRRADDNVSNDNKTNRRADHSRNDESADHNDPSRVNGGNNGSGNHTRYNASRDDDRRPDHKGDDRADHNDAAADTDLHAVDRLQNAAEPSRRVGRKQARACTAKRRFAFRKERNLYGGRNCVRRA